MVAEAWIDPDEWWAALAAEPVGGAAPLGILEQLAAGMPVWHAHAACRSRPDLDWFALADVADTTAVCATCPAQEACAEAGRQERFGVWGGQATELTSQLYLEAAGCIGCGNSDVFAKKRCRSCYDRTRRDLRAERRRRRSIPDQRADSPFSPQLVLNPSSKQRESLLDDKQG